MELPFDGPGMMEFCLKYKYADGPWLWEGARVGGKNGKVVIRNDRLPMISDLLDGPELGGVPWAITPLEDDVYRLEREVSDFQQWIPLGRPKKIDRWMSLVKIAAPWMGPHWNSSSTIELEDKEGVILLYRRRDGIEVCIVPLSGIEGMGNRYIRTMPDSNGIVAIEAHLGSPKLEVFVGCGTFQVVQKVMEAVRKRVGNKARCSDINTLDPWKSGLSYCTWNGLGWDLSDEKILFALQELHKNGIRVANLIIDDNWQTLEGRDYASTGTWSAFKANENFRGGLKGLVNEIKARFPYITNIGVWHALHGYWDGITQNSDIAQEYSCDQYPWNDNIQAKTRSLTLVSPTDVERLFDDFYRYLKECGITCTKADVQSRIDELVQNHKQAELMPAYQNALRKASVYSEKYFDGRTIYCMSHIPSILLGSLVQKHSIRQPVLRTSDDFYPGVIGSHSFHVYVNTLNQILFSCLDVAPDWDMFQTHDSVYGPLHAFARAFSGGAVFLTDIPGKHRIETLKNLAVPVVNSAALHTILPDHPAVALDPYFEFGSRRVFQIETTTRKGECRVRGFVNLDPTTAAFLLIPASELGITKPYILLAGSSNTTLQSSPNIEKSSVERTHIVLKIPSCQFVSFSAIPLEEAPFGEFAITMTDHYMGSGAILSSRVELPPTDALKSCKLEFEVGWLGLYRLFVYSKSVNVQVGAFSIGDAYFSVSMNQKNGMLNWDSECLRFNLLELVKRMPNKEEGVYDKAAITIGISFNWE